MNKGQRTIHRKMKNSDKNCVIRIFLLKEYWLPPIMYWAYESPSVEGQTASVACVHMVSKVRLRMITLSLFLLVSAYLSNYILTTLRNFFGNYQIGSYDYEHC